MNLLTKRRSSLNNATISDLSIDGIPECYCLERTDMEIPPGRYEIRIAESPRFSKRAAEPDVPPWLQALIVTDDQGKKTVSVPLLLNVPGRTGIEIHVANRPEELLGCLAPGHVDRGDSIGSSAAAFARLFTKIQNALKTEEVWIEISSAPNVAMPNGMQVPDSAST